MTLTAFCELQPIDKVQLVISTGTYLTQNRHASEATHLYFLPNAETGIFVELSYEPLLEAIVVVRSFTDAASLDAYASQIKLPRL